MQSLSQVHALLVSRLEWLWAVFTSGLAAHNLSAGMKDVS